MKNITRADAIDALRARFLQLADDEHCMCAVASKLHTFCGGFSQWNSRELRERYDWIVRRRPRIPRPQLEELANRWQLARQFVQGTELSCDTQSIEHHTCEGWDGFTDEQLATHYREVFGEDVEITPVVQGETKTSEPAAAGAKPR